MSTYLFILGKDRTLSLAELEARYPNGKTIATGSDFAVISLDEEMDQGEFNKLGGVIKVGELVGRCSKGQLPDELFNQLEAKHKGNKLNYGISLYGYSEKNLRTILIGLKKKLRNEGLSSRFANQNFQNISAAQYKDLRKKGIEILVARDGDNFYISEVVAVQDIDSYSRRDYYKPYRDMKVGMLPPKLAQIMINLTGSDGTIWDPFCGGGVLVMEGLLMGHDMLGSDIAQKHLDGAITNVDWLQKEYNFKNKVDLFVHDATKPMMDKKVEAIACEGYLGPPQTHIPSEDAVKPIILELDKLYVGFFSALKSVNFKGPIVIAMPFYRISNGSELELRSTVKKIEELGFVLKDSPLKYARPDQVVGRMIYRFN